MDTFFQWTPQQPSFGFPSRNRPGERSTDLQLLHFLCHQFALRFKIVQFLIHLSDFLCQGIRIGTAVGVSRQQKFDPRIVCFFDFDLKFLDLAGKFNAFVGEIEILLNQQAIPLFDGLTVDSVERDDIPFSHRIEILGILDNKVSLTADFEVGRDQQRRQKQCYDRRGNGDGFSTGLSTIKRSESA